MLTDIFSRRYEGKVLRDTVGKQDSRLLTQTFRILSEDLYPYYYNEKEDVNSVKFWTNLHSRLSRELGLKQLSQEFFSYETQLNGMVSRHTGKYTMLNVCENWLMQTCTGSADEYIKERLSLIELGFREKDEEIRSMNLSPIQSVEEVIAAFSRPSAVSRQLKRDFIMKSRLTKTHKFEASVEELNVRFRQAGYPLNYHNGFIQISTDDLTQKYIETPFWSLLVMPKWHNVEVDMKEALDLRDSDGRDPAFYAARSLESTIKIISKEKGWTHGKESGAHNFIDNLASKKNSFISDWEGKILKDFFTYVRNPFSHGAGSDAMPTLTRPQTEWAIEFSMVWIKNLINRL